VPSVEPPSGEQIEFTHGAQRAVVVEVGGGLRSYEVDGAPVLDGYAREAMCDGGRGQPLVPWPNRLADGQYEWSGRSMQLPVDELARRNASHGLTRWVAWHVAERSPSSVTMRHVIHPRPGYPFALDVAISYVLSDRGLTVTTRACNVGDSALPYGLGFHPYFTAGSGTIDQALLTLPARFVLDLDDRMLPTGSRAENSEFRSATRIGDRRIDGCFSDLERDADGLARVTLRAEYEVTLWLDATFKYLQVFTGDTLVPERRRQGVAIEPMTCPPNAFRSGVDLVRLAPGEECFATWGLIKR